MFFFWFEVQVSRVPAGSCEHLSVHLNTRGGASDALQVCTCRSFWAVVFVTLIENVPLASLYLISVYCRHELACVAENSSEPDSEP